MGLIDPNFAADLNLYRLSRVGSLVGCLYHGTVANCHVQGGSVSGSLCVGGLVGYNNGTIINCTSSASILWGHGKIGGLVGDNDGRIIECNSSGELSSHWFPGGLVGRNSGIISKCYSSSEVLGDHNVGGLVGENYDGIISNCYSTGSVTGSIRSRLCQGSRGQGDGGLVGLNAGIISNCYSVGSRTISSGRTHRGGLVGFDECGTITASFWDITTSGATTSAGGTGKLTGQMCSIETFLAAGWDFVDIWDICEGTNYPKLQWQIPAGDFVCPDGVSMVDFSFFAEHWLEETCDLGNDYCRGTDLDQSGTVDVTDLGIFLDNWLAGIAFPAEPRPIEFSLLAHWKLDEIEGSIAYNSAGENNSTLNGEPVWQPTGGKVSGALEFDGIDDYISTGFVLNPVDGPFSIFAWIKGGAPGQVIISQSDAGLGSAWLWASPSDGKLMTSLMYPEPPLESESVITDGDWHQIGLMWDECLRHLYVDGAEVAKDTHIVDPVSADGVLYFGVGEDAGSFWSGLIDDIRIYNQALSAKEIKELAR